MNVPDGEIISKFLGDAIGEDEAGFGGIGKSSRLPSSISIAFEIEGRSDGFA